MILSNFISSGWNDFPLENSRMVCLCTRSFQQVEPSVMTAIHFGRDIYANINNFPAVLMCLNFVLEDCCSILWYLSVHSVVMPVQQSGRKSFFWIYSHCTLICYKHKDTFDIDFSPFEHQDTKQMELWWCQQKRHGQPLKFIVSVTRKK